MEYYVLNVCRALPQGDERDGEKALCRVCFLGYDTGAERELERSTEPRGRVSVAHTQDIDGPVTQRDAQGKQSGGEEVPREGTRGKVWVQNISTKFMPVLCFHQNTCKCRLLENVTPA